MASFTVIINEHQRALLVAAMEAGLPAVKPILSAVPSDFGDESAFADAENLLAMLVDLPKQEAESPGCLHGLCL